MELDTPETTMSTNNNLDINGSATNNTNQNGNTTSATATTTSSLTSLNNGNHFLKSNHDTDIVRLIGQHLINLGLKQTVEQLLEESGLANLDHPVAQELQQHILVGEWDLATSLVDEIVLYSNGDKASNKNEILLLIAEQKFLELIEDNQHIMALKCLRLELTPIIEKVNNSTDVDININYNNKESIIKRIQHLATLLMCKTIDEVKLKADWPGKGLESRRKLMERIQQFIPPLIMLPPKRLTTLLSQAAQLQREKCILHIPNRDEDKSTTTSIIDNTNNSSNNNLINQNAILNYTTLKNYDINAYDYIDLKTDHQCSADRFPLSSKQALEQQGEVWFCKFSNDGQKLATAGYGGKIKIWDVDPETKLLIERSALDCSCDAIAYLSWSPNDVYLLACGNEDKQDLWIWNTLKEDVHNLISHSEDESITTCAWHMSSTKFAAGSMKGTFNIYDIDGNRSGSREGVRVRCMSFLHKDMDNILVSDSLQRIKSYAIRDLSLETYEEDILEENHEIMSFTIDKEDKFIAVNLKDQGIHLWDYNLKTLLRMFPGVSQRNFMIYSSFSSPNATFLASGSEDGKVYIYHTNKEQPVAILQGHTRCVNCVTWNPIYPELLVSVSDDRIVRLWGPIPSISRKDPSIVKQEPNKSNNGSN